MKSEKAREEERKDYCENCTHMCREELVNDGYLNQRGLYVWVCEWNEEPQWDEDEEEFTCEDYKEAVIYDDF